MKWVLILLASVCQAQQPGSGGPAAIFDKIYASAEPPFNQEPSAFLTRAVEGLTPGKALDVAMGQGRNSLFLARKGWQVTGYDVSSVGLAAAQRSAEKAGLKIETALKSHTDFDFGTDQWDLVVMVFPGTSMDDLELLRKIKASMKKGGMIVVEQFNAPPGEGAKGPANALFRTWEEFRVVRYEDVVDKSDWGKMKARIGRIAAVKE
jgi:2-polyprenyl-3-methyl-5-hydroxy-6-metoxy-1,4-benzoquinol methylase